MAYANIISHNITAVNGTRRNATQASEAERQSANLYTESDNSYEAAMQAIKVARETRQAKQNIAQFFVALAQVVEQEAMKITEAKPAFLTRKALIAACQNMNLDTVLFNANYRSSNNRGHAVEIALGTFMTTTFGQQYHATKRGQSANPRWFKQLFTDLAWASDNITPGSILQALVK